MAGPPKNWVVFLLPFFDCPRTGSGGLLMFATIPGRRFLLILTLILALVTIPVLAETASHTIAVTVPEIGRYRVNGITLVQSSANERVYQVDMSVFSNSQRQWKIVANADSDIETLEWSIDGQNWSGVAAGMTTLATGAKADWLNIRIYYRHHQAGSATESPLNLQYQLCFNN